MRRVNPFEHGGLKMSNNTNMVRKATETQLTFLRNIGASFKVVLADGEVIVHDPNNLIEPNKTKNRGPSRNPGVKFGEPTAYVSPFIQGLEPGQSVDIPHKYHKYTMRSVACNEARRIFGSNNYMTQITDSHITVLRVN